MEVIAEAENGQQAVEMTKKIKPDVVIMDLAMPMMNGLTATKQIEKLFPAPRFSVLTSDHDEQCVKDMLNAGALGFIMKESASTELAAGVRNVRRGTRVLSPALVADSDKLQRRVPGQWQQQEVKRPDGSRTGGAQDHCGRLHQQRNR